MPETEGFSELFPVPSVWMFAGMRGAPGNLQVLWSLLHSRTRSSGHVFFPIPLPRGGRGQGGGQTPFLPLVLVVVPSTLFSRTPTRFSLAEAESCWGGLVEREDPPFPHRLSHRQWEVVKEDGILEDGKILVSFVDYFYTCWVLFLFKQNAAFN